MAGLAGIERIGRVGLAGITGGHCQLPPARGSIRGSHGALRFSLPTRRRRRGGAGGGGKGGGGAVSTHGVARRGGNLGEGVRVGHTSTHRPLFKCFYGLPYGLSIRCSTNCHELSRTGRSGGCLETLPSFVTR